MRDPAHTAKLALSLAAVYVIWGSSFLATKVAVAHLPIALFSAVRFLIAGSLLALLSLGCSGISWPRRWRDWRHFAITGFFMVFVNNGLNAWALQYLPTNESALLNGTAAFWIAGLGVFGPRGHPLTRTAVMGLVIGFAGTALMLLPNGSTHVSSVAAQAAALGACLAFALGTLYFRSVDTQVDSLMFMAMQLWLGGLMLLVVAVLHGDMSRWSFNAPGVTALAYLTLASSCLAFSAYGWLMRNATPALIGTYSYVNPAIAAFLGWEFLHEQLTHGQLVGMVIIIVGVALLTLSGGSLTDPKTLAEPKA